MADFPGHQWFEVGRIKEQDQASFKAMIRVQGDPELPRAAIRCAGFDLEAAAVRVNEVVALSPGRGEGAFGS